MKEYKNYKGYDVAEDGEILTRYKKPFATKDNGRGYLIVHLYHGGTSYEGIAVHRLVAFCWVTNENPSLFTDVNHKDGNKRNNHASNLEWVTKGANQKHAYALKLRCAQGENNARCQTTEKEVLEIAKLLTEGNMPATIRDMGYAYTRIRSIRARKNWGWLTKDFVW